MAPIGQGASVENHRSVFVAEFGHSARFAQKTFGYVFIGGKLRFDDFYGNWPFQAQVSGKIDGSHSSGANFALDAKPTGDDLGDIHYGPSFGIKGRSERRQSSEEKRRIRASPNQHFSMRGEKN
jgi:hypothetical protein